MSTLIWFDEVSDEQWQTMLDKLRDSNIGTHAMGWISTDRGTRTWIEVEDTPPRDVLQP